MKLAHNSSTLTLTLLGFSLRLWNTFLCVNLKMKKKLCIYLSILFSHVSLSHSMFPLLRTFLTQHFLWRHYTINASLFGDITMTLLLYSTCYCSLSSHLTNKHKRIPGHQEILTVATSPFQTFFQLYSWCRISVNLYFLPSYL